MAGIRNAAVLASVTSWDIREDGSVDLGIRIAGSVTDGERSVVFDPPHLVNVTIAKHDVTTADPGILGNRRRAAGDPRTRGSI